MMFKKKNTNDLMVKTYWYITKEQKRKVAKWAKVRGVTESEIIRNLIDKK